MRDNDFDRALELPQSSAREGNLLSNQQNSQQSSLKRLTVNVGQRAVAMRFFYVIALTWSAWQTFAEDRAEVTIRFECAQWRNITESVKEFIYGFYKGHIRVCFAFKSMSATKCDVSKDLPTNLTKCKEEKHRRRKTEVSRFKKKISMTHSHLYFNIFASFKKDMQPFNTSLKVLSRTSKPHNNWFPLNSTETLSSFLKITARLTCLESYSGDRCQHVDPCYQHPCPDGRKCFANNTSAHCAEGLFLIKESSEGVAIKLDWTTLGCSAAALSVVLLIGLGMWYCFKKRKRTRSEDEHNEDIYTYAAPYDDIGHSVDRESDSNSENLKNIEKESQRYGVEGNLYTFQTSVDEVPNLPPR